MASLRDESPIKPECLFEFRQKPRLLIRLSTDHDTIDVLQVGTAVSQSRDAAVEYYGQIRIRLLQPIDPFVVELWHRTVFLRTQTRQNSDACMDNECFASCCDIGADKFLHKFVGVEIIDAYSRFDRSRHADCRLHRPNAIGDNLRM